MALTPKQSRFVAEYLIDLNATQAAIRAGYSEANAETIAYQLLQKTPVAEAVSAAAAEHAANASISAGRTLAEIRDMAFYDPADLAEVSIPIEDGADIPAGGRVQVDANGRGFVITGLRGPADLKHLPENARRAIVGWGWDKAGNFTIKLADKSKALDQLARHLSLYNDKIEVNVADGLADRIARAKARGQGGA